jgi:hypothetical protein
MILKSIIKYLYSYFGLFLLLLILIPLALLFLDSMSKVFFLALQVIKIFFLEKGLIDWILLINTLVNIFCTIFMTYFLVFIYFVISSIATYKSYEQAAKKHSYMLPDLIDVFNKSLSWNVYRLLYILNPLKTIGIIIVCSFITSIILFNFILALIGFNLAISAFLAIFVFLCFIVGMLISFGMAVFRIFMTLFGIECAISEPVLDNYVIKKRSQRLLLSNKTNIKLFIAYFIFIIILLTQFLGIILYPDKLNSDNITLLTICICLDVVSFLSLGFLKSSLYVDSIIQKYNRITFKDKLYLRKIVSDL